MNKPVSCRYSYGDYFRGKHKKNAGSWQPMPTTPIPGNAALRQLPGPRRPGRQQFAANLALEAKVTRRFLSSRVEISLPSAPATWKSWLTPASAQMRGRTTVRQPDLAHSDPTVQFRLSSSNNVASNTRTPSMHSGQPCVLPGHG
jgi:hypothetical protein